MERVSKGIINHASLYPAKQILTDEHGVNFEQKIIMRGEKDKPANDIVGWRVKNKETWMTTCYIKELD